MGVIRFRSIAKIAFVQLSSIKGSLNGLTVAFNIGLIDRSRTRPINLVTFTFPRTETCIVRKREVHLVKFARFSI